MEEGWDDFCGSGSATGSCDSGTDTAANLTWYWRYETPLLFLMPTLFTFFVCVRVEVGSPFMEHGLSGLLP